MGTSDSQMSRSRTWRRLTLGRAVFSTQLFSNSPIYRSPDWQAAKPLLVSIRMKCGYDGLAIAWRSPRRAAQTNNKSVFGSVAVGMLAWDDSYDHMPAATQHMQLSSAVTIVRNQLTIVWNQLVIENSKITRVIVDTVRLNHRKCGPQEQGSTANIPTYWCESILRVFWWDINFS